MERTQEVHLPDQNQTLWQLSAIQLAGWTSLPVLATSLLILEKNSFLGAVLTTFVGNAILWFLRLAILSMSFKKRQSTLDISKEYMGNFGGYVIAALLLFATLAWFIAQTTSASDALAKLIVVKEDPRIDEFTQVSILVGIVSAFLCMEGIVLLRRLCTAAFPFIFLSFLVGFFFLPAGELSSENPTTLYGLSFVLATNLGVTSDFPTFFRHSSSWNTSVKALTLIQIISLGLGILSLFFSSVFTSHALINVEAVLNGAYPLRAALIFFIFASVICTNVANVYSASVGWEILAPKALVGRKEYLILGLGLTTIFVLVANFFSIELLLNFADSGLVNLSMVLILGFFIHRLSKKPLRLSDQWTYFSFWVLATTVNFFQYLNLLDLPLSPFSSAVFIMAILLLSHFRKFLP